MNLSISQQHHDFQSEHFLLSQMQVGVNGSVASVSTHWAIFPLSSVPASSPFILPALPLSQFPQAQPLHTPVAGCIFPKNTVTSLLSEISLYVTLITIKTDSEDEVQVLDTVVYKSYHSSPASHLELC